MHLAEQRLSRLIDERDLTHIDEGGLPGSPAQQSLPAAFHLVHPGSSQATLQDEPRSVFRPFLGNPQHVLTSHTSISSNCHSSSLVLPCEKRDQVQSEDELKIRRKDWPRETTTLDAASSR